MNGIQSSLFLKKGVIETLIITGTAIFLTLPRIRCGFLKNSFDFITGIFTALATVAYVPVPGT